MKFKTLLVHVDDSRQSDARTEFALDLARRWDAHVIGLYVVCQDLMRPLFRRDESLRLAANEAQHAERCNAAQARFTAAGGRAGVNFEWRAPAGPPIDVATLHARHADLVVLGQPDPDDAAAYIEPHFVDDVVMSGGVPAIVLPFTGAMRTFGENVLIAWDGSREAARAVTDALPLLKRARFVTVESVLRRRTTGADLAPAGIDIAAYLGRHGIQASFSTSAHVPGVETGAALLNRAADLHTDLLVLGAYGHTRARERVLGGVTRTMLEAMTVPVLLSH
ncbi:universal stress protein [Burkholderia thailandensis]|uniref:Universal stress protein family domain protein n=1 Tax=Burkholderia thailandensis (strain ATCC 700388 / DSM 13276 / CCUG 48851 / CIP 106301 / E264) TaxID=271848 RepID=Q2T4Y6_BURTA|nr:universal stress protein [Burkholderia thailandensis]ABC35436.1 universal stress protein family domain protein [Burkholderia thailandensis E264]AHI77153.1 universal stress family protein [Burkholderia thailandensis 2002721723]AHI81035.1 universal stress family protein [Burkholderia thailandensis E444]AIC90517.1 universal stress family protein [Burkholderia thailandensis USAMRU Malaysia \